MIAALVATIAVAGGGPPSFVESRIDVGTDRFEYQLADVDADRLLDLIVTSSVAAERTLRIWRQRADATFPAAPDFRLTIPPDVVSWALLDVRSDPGDELLLLTRGGVFSLTTTKPGLQGNLRREIALPLFPDFADPDRLPCWRLSKDVDGDGRNELLVVSDRELVALAVERGEDGSTKLVPRSRCPGRSESRDEGSAQLSLGSGGLSVTSHRSQASLFPGARSSRPSVEAEPLLSRRERLLLPALLDWDGDKRLDVVELGEKSISVRRQAADGSFAATAESWPTPPLLRDENGEMPKGTRRAVDAPRLDLLDVDGDGNRELVVIGASGPGTSAERIALVYERDATGKPDDVPSARVKLAGMNVEYGFVDVDHDGKLDVTARLFNIPTGLTSLATIRLDISFLVFRGHDDAIVSREPDLKFERSYRPEQLGRVEEVLLTNLTGDFDQDGLNDLVATQLDGRVEVRPLQRAGERFELAARPLASFQPASPVERIEAWDISLDGVADLLLRHDHGFTIFVSKAGGGGP
jgi:hypothetical protein